MVVARGLDPLGEAEVEDLDVAVAGHEDVVGLQVPMHDTLAVGGGESLRDLQAPVDGLPLGDGRTVELPAQRFSLEELRNGVGHAVVGPELEDREDVRVREGRDGFGLALEPRERIRVRRQVPGKDFDRHLAIELRVARAVDLAHSPRTEWPEDLVVTEFCSGGETHRMWARG